jgi:hypothetical protein
MRRKVFDIDLDDADADGVVAAVATPSGAMTLDGAYVSGGVATFDYARQLAIASDGVDNGITFTVVGTDADGYALTEVVTGPNATTVESTNYFKTVSSITLSGAAVGTVTVGTVDEACTQTIPIKWRSENACTINLDVTGTISVTVQETFDDVQRVGYTPQSANQNSQWLSITALATKTADTTATSTVSASAIRLLVNSYSSGAEVQMTVIPPTD